ncbi:tetraacyldisaccharide 4'-kinase [Thalassospira sp. TSL5-1]|uniref:tetraacyldisaccharide 4'-kinase n=1 Tax=Thalassospira sp. TSL5-1 TaxID=1544451 RepID=UPI00093B861F|nr:tetraacyldisaccharide 4'-kinase [Thalassospira sp. TSL5-1]OKH88904.1 tetraacyldisaccharide 4'-kinase [Thalassospira sp. TSL5-1]
MHAPDFWQTDNMIARALSPASWLWRAGAAWRNATTTALHPGCPVICLGNFTVGGAGKTPSAQAIYDILTSLGHQPHFLSRGYGGTRKGPHRVDPTSDTAHDVGDEPLLLSQKGPAWVSRNRAAGADAIAVAGADVIIMDDGLQNPSLIKDLGIVVVDGATGFGNERVLPAGPLRETLKSGFSRVRAAIIIGEDKTGLAQRMPKHVSVFSANVRPENPSDFTDQKVLAFAGIGRPGKFYKSLRDCGAEVAIARDFADHHFYSPDELIALRADAARAGALLVTTEKDLMRLPLGDRHGIKTLRIALEFDDLPGITQLIETVFANGA